MHRFQIWAPFAKQLAVSANGSAHAMNGPDEDGWWSLECSDAGPGTDYGFLVNGEPKPYPDPRSQWQPNGVHGLSRVYDQNAFAWTDADFQAPPLASTVVY